MMEMTAGSGSDNEENSKEQESGRELIILKKALSEFVLNDEIFIVHKEPKSNRIVLTEAQFNLVKKVYTRCFIKDKFSLSDNQLVTQFFLNLKVMRNQMNKQDLRCDED
jgi:hypothetical protein